MPIVSFSLFGQSHLFVVYQDLQDSPLLPGKTNISYSNASASANKLDTCKKWEDCLVLWDLTLISTQTAQLAWTNAEIVYKIIVNGYIHTHTLAHWYTQKYIFTHTLIHINYTPIHTCTHTNIHKQTEVNTFDTQRKHIYTLIHIFLHIHTAIHIHKSTCCHILTHLNADTYL